MDLVDRIILVKRLPNSVKPYVVFFDVYQGSKEKFHGSKYFPATDEEIDSILEANDVDPSSYTNPLKTIPVEKKEQKKKEQIKKVELEPQPSEGKKEEK